MQYGVTGGGHRTFTPRVDAEHVEVSQAGEQILSNIVEVILHQYPNPIAKCYERLVGARDHNERWNRTRYLIEVTLKYCACIAVSRYLHNGNLDDKTNAALTCLNRPSLGHWHNLLVRCARHNQNMNAAFLQEEVFTATHDRPAMAEAYQAMKSMSEKRGDQAPRKITLTRFLEAYVAYRNRTAGHGAPSAEHVEQMAPLLEKATVDLLQHLDALRNIQLVYVSGIRLERNSCIHSLTRLMGTTQVAMPDYVTSVNDALIGRDRQLFLSEPGDEKPFVSLHPLAIYSRDEVYLLHQSDLRSNVDYICHHSGEYYSADRIFEDFRAALGGFLGETQVDTSRFSPEDVYRESVRMSLVDGVITAQEHTYLMETRLQLGLDAKTAEAIERTEKAEMPAVENPAPGTPVATGGGHNRLGDNGDENRARRLLFFSYASVGNTFWAEFVSRLAATAHERDWVFSMVTPNPKHDHDVAAMANLVADLDRIIDMHRPDAIMMVPVPSTTFTSLFEKRFRGRDVPIVALDTAFSGSEVFAEHGGREPPAIVIDNAAGGALAAEALVDALQGKDAGLRYLVMPGLEDAPHSQARVDGFRERLEALQPDARIRVMPEGRFDRCRARQVFGDFLEDIDLDRFAGIFCCNDDMALGVFLAASKYLKRGGQRGHFSIVGFNNTAEFRIVMAADPYGLLVASIDQSLDKYTALAFSTLDALLAGGTVDSQVRVQPSMAVIAQR